MWSPVPHPKSTNIFASHNHNLSRTTSSAHKHHRSHAIKMKQPWHQLDAQPVAVEWPIDGPTPLLSTRHPTRHSQLPILLSLLPLVLWQPSPTPTHRSTPPPHFNQPNPIYINLQTLPTSLPYRLKNIIIEHRRIRGIARLSLPCSRSSSSCNGNGSMFPRVGCWVPLPLLLGKGTPSQLAASLSMLLITKKGSGGMNHNQKKVSEGKNYIWLVVFACLPNYASRLLSCQHGPVPSHTLDVISTKSNSNLTQQSTEINPQLLLQKCSKQQRTKMKPRRAHCICIAEWEIEKEKQGQKAHIK